MIYIYNYTTVFKELYLTVCIKNLIWNTKKISKLSRKCGLECKIKSLVDGCLPVTLLQSRLV